MHDPEPSNDSPLQRQMAHWAEGVRSELRYWRKTLQSAQKAPPEWYLKRTLPNRPVPDEIAPLLPASGRADILDVGAGPLSACGDRLGDRTMNLVPVDPLAHFYSQIWHEVGAEPPIATRFGFAEDVSCQFAEGSFDAVVSFNALDHTIDPVRALIEMLIVTRVGGVVFLEHHLNESVTHDGHGLHQWNFDRDGDDFIVWSRSSRVNVTQQFKPFADVKVSSGAGDIKVLMTKQASPVEDLAEFHRVHRHAYLEAFLGFVAARVLPPPFGMPSVRRHALKTLLRFR
jgi:SAM-dependent methyltransferase